ncbi:MAG: SDR family oxidoreductase [Arenicella sp.]
MAKNIVITGANRGIGLSLSKHYQANGCQVYGACRNSSAELEASGAKVITGIDVANDDSIEELAEQLSGVKIKLLINNAGILRNETLGDIDYDSIQSQFAVNALGPLKVTEALQNNFALNAKLVMITSRMGSIEDNSSGGRYGYRMSKAALNCAAMSLSHDLRAQGVAVGIIHPGLVGTEMIGGKGDLTPDQAAANIVQRIDELEPENSGTFWHSNGEILPW